MRVHSAGSTNLGGRCRWRGGTLTLTGSFCYTSGVRSGHQNLLDSLEQMAVSEDYRQVAASAISILRDEVKGDYFSVCAFEADFQNLEVLHPGEGWLGAESPVLRALRFIQSTVPASSDHPAMVAFGKNPRPGGFIRSLLLPDRQWIKTTHYQVVDRGLGIRDMASIFLISDQNRIMILNCGRTRAFRDSELRSIVRVERVLTALLAGRAAGMRHAKANGSNHPITCLTPRELEILHWVDEGKRNSEIAVILSISAHTVRKHLENIFSKLGVEPRAGAAKALEA